MIEQIIISIIIGILVGTVTGLIPGLHINLLIAIISSSFSFLFSGFNPFITISFITSLSITHILINFIPSIYLGAPNSDTALMVLPGHRMLKQGHGHHALTLNIAGAIFGLLFILILSPLLILTIPNIYEKIVNYIGYLLIVLSIFLVLRNKKNVYWAFIILILSGILGIVSLNTASIKEPLLPLFSGLFGASTLLLSVKSINKIPKQKDTKEILNKKKLIKYSFIGSLSTSIFSFLPTLSPSQIAAISSSVTGKLNAKDYLVLLGSINLSSFLISIFALYLISKARNLPIVFISELLEGKPQLNTLLVILICVVISSTLVAIIALKTSKYFSKKISKINYKKLILSLIIFIIFLVIFLSGIIGLIVLVTGTALGILCQQKRVNKNILMASLILPTILYYIK